MWKATEVLNAVDQTDNMVLDRMLGRQPDEIVGSQEWSGSTHSLRVFQ